MTTLEPFLFLLGFISDIEFVNVSAECDTTCVLAQGIQKHAVLTLKNPLLSVSCEVGVLF